MSSAAGRFAAVLAALALLAGCASIPSSGPVVAGRAVDGGTGRNVIQVFPVPPSPDMTPRELLLQFLRSAPAFSGDHEGARSFLSPQRRTSWSPDSPVTIYSGEDALSITVVRGTATVTGPLVLPVAAPSPTPSASPSASPSGSPSGSAPASGSPAPSASPSASRSASPSASATSSAQAQVDARPRAGERATIVLRSPVEAHVDAGGQYLPAAPGTVETRTFSLVGTDDGWRIDGLDDGIMITRYDFGITYRDLPVYFADPTATYLVPDVRWFPVSGSSSTASSLVSTLLAGPADWLAPAVVSGAPTGTRATVNAVKITDGQATVDLTAEARSADARQRVMLKAQLEQTLAGLSTVGTAVSAVAVTVEQQRFELQPAPGAAASAPAPARDEPGSGRSLGPPPQVDARPVVLDSRGAVARLVGRSPVPVEGLAALNQPGTYAPATDAAGQAFAVLAGGRTRLLYAVPGGSSVSLVVGRDLVPPSFDPFGWVWTAQHDSRGTVYAARPDAGAVPVVANWLARERLVSLRLSREGARALIVTESPDGARHAVVSGVRRDGQGRPSALTSGVELLSDAAEVSAAVWVDQTHVAVLARRPGSGQMPWVVQLGGEARATLPAAGVWLTAGNSESDLYLQTAAGKVLSRVGSSWSEVPGVRWPSVPG